MLVDANTGGKITGGCKRMGGGLRMGGSEKVNEGPRMNTNEHGWKSNKNDEAGGRKLMLVDANRGERWR